MPLPCRRGDNTSVFQAVAVVLLDPYFPVAGAVELREIDRLPGAKLKPTVLVGEAGSDLETRK